MKARRGVTSKIYDDLTDVPMSRQRRWQIRRMREHECIICGKSAFKHTLFCLKHNHKRGIKDPGKNAPHAGKKWG